MPDCVRTADSTMSGFAFTSQCNIFTKCFVWKSCSEICSRFAYPSVCPSVPVQGTRSPTAWTAGTPCVGPQWRWALRDASSPSQAWPQSRRTPSDWWPAPQWAGARSTRRWWWPLNAEVRARSLTLLSDLLFVLFECSHEDVQQSNLKKNYKIKQNQAVTKHLFLFKVGKVKCPKIGCISVWYLQGHFSYQILSSPWYNYIEIQNNARMLSSLANCPSSFSTLLKWIPVGSPQDSTN